MSGLNLLPAQTVSLLRSGQVLTSPSCVVKELVENSIDAGATSIEIRMGDYGLEAIEATELRRRTETILVLVATDYQFCYHNPSLLAASAILTALQSMSVDNEKVLREIRLRLQTATHTATVSLMEYYLQMIEFSNDAEHCSF